MKRILNAKYSPNNVIKTILVGPMILSEKETQLKELLFLKL